MAPPNKHLLALIKIPFINQDAGFRVLELFHIKAL
jgi:hypothetical protein